jgi:hypothetical protein
VSTTPTPRISKLSGTVQWDDGVNFDGYVKVAVSFPSGWTTLFKKSNTSITPVKLPEWSVIPIEDGTFSQELGLFYNSDMSPHNTKYTATYYDKTLKLISGPGSTFTASSETTAVPIPTLTAPVAPA